MTGGRLLLQQFPPDQGQGGEEDQSEGQGLQQQPVAEEGKTGEEESRNAYTEEGVVDKVACYGGGERHYIALLLV